VKRNRVCALLLAALFLFGAAPAMAEWVKPLIADLETNVIPIKATSSVAIPDGGKVKNENLDVQNVLERVNDKVYVRKEVIDSIAGASAVRQRIPLFEIAITSPDEPGTDKVGPNQSAVVMHPLTTASFAGNRPSDLRVIKVYGDGASDRRSYALVDGVDKLIDGTFAIVKADKKALLGANETIQSGLVYYLALCLKRGGNYDIGKTGAYIVDPTFVYTSTAPVPVTGVTISPTVKVIAPDATFTFTAGIEPSTATNQNVEWTSSNPSVATIDEDGRVDALAEGTTTIRVTTEDQGKTDSATLYVGTPVTSVSVFPEAATIGVGGTVSLIETILPVTAPLKTVKWSTSDASIATVSDDGVVTGRGAGTATITVTTTDGGKTDFSKITVVSVPQPVTPGFQLPSGVEDPFTVVPGTVGESGLNSAAADTVEQTTVSASASSSGTYLVLKDQVINNILSYHGNGMDSSVKIKMPVFKALVSSAGKTGVVMFQLPSSSLAGHKAGMVLPVKVVSTSASEARSFSFVDSASKLADGKFGIVTSNKTTFMGAEDIIQSGGTYYIAFAIKDGGRFDMNNADMYITDPTFVGLSTGHRSSSGGCSTGAFAPAVLLMLLPLAALLRKRG